jgi:hypothetical protein
MKIFLSRDDKNLLKCIPFFFIILFFISCKKSLNENIDSNNTPPDLVTKITSSVSGYVTDQYDVAIVAADVKVGTSNTTTDRYGYFEIKNVEVVKEAATVTVSFPGFFKGIKTYMATSGKSAFFRIKLIPKTNVGNINAGTGGAVSLTNGLNISLPANAVKIASTGSIYSGTVNVAATWIDPTSPELHKIMPGDLRGINTDGLMKGLTTYGMMAVELTGSSGELLQIADGKKSVITFPIPASISSSAPATIPLWYFNETNGLWKEEGIATKTGNTYMGEVSHFSFWNCDMPNIIINFNCTILNTDGSAFPFIKVRIFESANPVSSRIGYTDQNGYVSGGVPANTNLTMEVIFEAFNCNNGIIYSHNFRSGSETFSMGNIIVTSPGGIANLKGRVKNCTGNTVNNGCVWISGQNISYRVSLDNTGAYNFSIPLCNTNNNIILFAEDFNASQLSNNQVMNLVPGINNAADLLACGTSTDVYLNLTINGRTFICNNQILSGANVTQYGMDSIVTSINWASLEVANGIPVPNSPSNIQFGFWSFGPPQNNTTPHFLYYMAPHATNLLNHSVNIQPLSYFANNYREVPLHITEYGVPGQFISGSYAGRLYEDVMGQPDLTRPYDVNCSFRVRRNP